MKLHKIIIPIVACTLTLSSCYDEKMDWGKPGDHGDVTIAEMPLQLAEQIANYDFIKKYAEQYAPHMTIGLGMGADLYISDPEYRQVADDNFQLFTTGNAMKHAVVVKSNGELDFTQIDQFLALAPQNIELYGHNFLWHTQQKQAYLKTLIAPEVVIETDPSGKVENVITNSDFEAGNISGWAAWSSAGCTAAISEKGKGYKSDYAMILHNPLAGDNYSAQAYYKLPSALEVGATYIYSCYVYSVAGDEKFQFQLQNRTSYAGDAYKGQAVPAGQWFYLEQEFVLTQAMADKNMDYVVIDFGGAAGDCYIDNVQFGKKKDDPDAHRTNLLSNGSFPADIASWGQWNPNPTPVVMTFNADEGNNAKGCIQVVNTYSDAGSQYKTQIHSDFVTNIAPGSNAYISYYIKTIAGEGSVRCSTTGDAKYQGDQVVNSVWTRVEWEITAGTKEITGLNFDLGAVPNTYLIDDIVVSTEPFTAVAAKSALKATTRAGGITYKFKTAEEKKTALLKAMEDWIKGMLTHEGMERVKAWDVINEPIADNNQWRGVDGNFMSNGEDAPDTAPVEDPASGFSLNWAADHFYWGYYIGKEYAVKAFEYARKYAPAGTKMYVNDYNLETSPNKLAALIDFVKYIEDNGQVVDGIGTQMHVTPSITREQIDAMFKTMAATGKLVRVTELDVALATASPSNEQLEQQANIYQMIFESFKANVPEAQQSGITIWTLTDNKREHEYWLKDQSPNIFDANYGRKHAYKGVCDGIAGKDIGAEFSGEDWKNAYKEEETPAE